MAINYKSEALREARKNKKKTTDEVSKDLAVAYWQIQSLEQNEMRGFLSDSMMLSALKKYCHYLELDFEDIIIKDEEDEVEDASHEKQEVKIMGIEYLMFSLLVLIGIVVYLFIYFKLFD